MAELDALKIKFEKRFDRDQDANLNLAEFHEAVRGLGVRRATARSMQSAASPAQ